MRQARRGRRWRAWAGVLAIFALAIPLAAAVLVRSEASRTRLVELASAALRDELGLEARLGTVHLELVPLTVVARRITLDDPVYGRFAEAEELRIQPSFRALLRGAVDLNGIEVRRGQVRLVVRNGSVRNLPETDGAEGGGRPELPFDELRVVDSTLTIDADPIGAGGVTGVELTVRQGSAAIEVDVRSRRGWVVHGGGRDIIERIAAHVEVGPDRARVDHLEVRSEPLTVRARDASLPLPPGLSGYEGHVEVAYDLGHLRRIPFPDGVDVPPVLGRVELDGTLETIDGQQTARGGLTLLDGRIEQFGLGSRLQVRFRATPEEVRILDGSRLENVDRGGVLRLAGSVGLDPESGFPLDVEVGIDDLSFGKLMDDLGVTDNALVDWMFNGRARLSGTLDPLDLAGPIRTRTHDFVVTSDGFRTRSSRRIVGVRQGTVGGRWSIRPDGIRFESLTADMPRSVLHADVFLGFDDRLMVRAHAPRGDLADITPLDAFPIGGVGRAEVTVDGTFGAPEVRGHLAFDDFLFHTFRLGRVESDAVLDPDGLGVTFPLVSAVRGDSTYRAQDLVLDFRSSRFAMTTRLHLDAMELADLYTVFGLEEDERFEPYQGLTRGTADVVYTNGYPGDSPNGTLDLALDARLPRGSISGYAFTDGRIQARYRWLDWDRGLAGAELEVPRFTVHKDGATVSATGRMRLGGDLDIDLVADAIPLRAIEGIGDQLPGVEGVASVLGHVGGTAEVMHGDFDVGVTNVTYLGSPLGDGRAYVRLTDPSDPWVAAAGDWEEIPEGEACPEARRGLARASWPPDPPARTVDGPTPRLPTPMAFLICGQGLDGDLDIDLALGRTAVLPVRGRLLLGDLDLAPFLPEGPPEPEGRLSAEVRFDDGALLAPETLRGELRLPVLVLRQDGIELRNEGPVEVALASGVLEVGRARFVGPGSRLRVRGQAGLEEGLALRVDGDLDFAVLAGLSSAVEHASGRVRARLDVGGPLADPELFGRAIVEEGAFRFAGYDEPVEQIEGTIRFDERSVTVEGFSAETAGGRVEAEGSADVSGRRLQRYAVELHADGIRVEPIEGVDIAFDGRARLSWNDGERLPTLAGVLTVDRFAYTRPIELRSLGDVAASAVRGALSRQRASVRRYDPEADMVSLDLRVEQRAPFRIRNNLVDAEVLIAADETPLRIVGTDQRYGVEGRLALSRGRLFFQNNDFDVRRGIISFDDPTRIEPYVDVEAVTEVRRSSDLSAPSWRITLIASGNAERLQLVTRSEPDLPEQDILFLLAFGLTRGELQQGGGQSLASSAALEALTSVTGVDREVSRALPLVDDIRLTTGYSPRTGRSEPRISIGKRIANRVRLSATTGLGEAREFRAAAEWQLDARTRFQLSYDNYNVIGTAAFGNLGFDLGYRLEFE
ncbi:MAG: translocation/assembly module TamB domain-containing protein [Sandaracinaceae bacterium]